MNDRPTIAHVLYRFDTGGMERIVLSVINGTRERYHHALICLTDFGMLRDQIVDQDIPVRALAKKPGKDWKYYGRLWRVLREIRPDLLQTYNVGALDVAPVARLAGVRRVVHAEHGRDYADPYGKSRKYRRLRRLVAPFVDRQIVVSHDLQLWLTNEIGIAATRTVYIPNGLDTPRMAAVSSGPYPRKLLGEFAPPGTLLIGTVGRLDPVKNHIGLVNAFHDLCQSEGEAGWRLRLVIVGEGVERQHIEQRVAELDLSLQVRLLGNRNDVASLLPECDIFVLPSLAEGMPVTLLEAMAAGLPVVATAVGGVAEVVVPGATGFVVPAGNPHALATALRNYLCGDGLRAAHGRAGAERVKAHFSMTSMLSAYTALYDELLSVDTNNASRTVAVRTPGCKER